MESIPAHGCALEMRITLLLALLTAALVGTACQTKRDLALEREYPFELGEPAYLLKPSDFPMSDLMAVWVPRQPPKSTTSAVPLATVRAIGPENTTAPVLTRASRASLAELVAELPEYLPRRAVFLVSSHGQVVEVAFRGARDKLNERVFAARLRALRFTPATHVGRPVAVVCEMNLRTGAIPPERRGE